MPAAPLMTRPSWTTPPPSPVPTIAETELRRPASGAVPHVVGVERGGVAVVVVHDGDAEPRLEGAPDVEPGQPAWPKLVAPPVIRTPRALAGPGVSSPTARTCSLGTRSSRAPCRSRRLAAGSPCPGPSRTRLGSSAIVSTRNRPRSRGRCRCSPCRRCRCHRHPVARYEHETSQTVYLPVSLKTVSQRHRTREQAEEVAAQKKNLVTGQGW